ncbi:RagB/SusD family nutrient uptake outer membrane protein [Portibacter lacus]|nr:RagB/SusD family nutrient uptake outer membrane protein [Portibacter lacus]
MKNIIITSIILTLSITSCNLDIAPTNLSTIDALLEEEGGIATATNGTYALFKDVLAFRGQEAGNLNNDYTRHLYQMSEFASDNVMYTQFSGDPLYLVFTREHIPDQENSSYFWFIAYRMILGTNLIIANAETGVDADTDQIVGENYFLRALASHDLLRFFAKPYSHGRENPGIVLRTSITDENIKARSTVGEGYDQVVADLLKAEELMSDGNSRGVEFGSKLAAQALLARVYLEMEEHDLAIEYADKVINNNQGVKLASNSEYLDNFANTPSSSESIFVIKFTLQDHRGKNGSIGSMYYDDGNGTGWGEVFASESYLDAIRSNPEDIRNELVLSTGGTKSGYPIHYITKFSGQDGIVNLSSPQYLRLSETYLIRAEAYAKKGQTQEALNDVNIIRERAGLSGDKLYTTDNIGSKSVLEIVLDEKRIEMAFEGQRYHDLVRNKIDLNRNYIGIHNENGDTRTVIPWDDDRSIFFIPNIELVTNPSVVQNQ